VILHKLQWHSFRPCLAPKPNNHPLHVGHTAYAVGQQRPLWNLDASFFSPASGRATPWWQGTHSTIVVSLTKIPNLWAADPEVRSGYSKGSANEERNPPHPASTWFPPLLLWLLPRHVYVLLWWIKCEFIYNGCWFNNRFLVPWKSRPFPVTSYPIHRNQPYFKASSIKKKRSSSPITGLDRPTGFQEVEAPGFLDNRRLKVVRLSALRTGRVYPPLEAESTPGP
jgi:hypothetical protein